MGENPFEALLQKQARQARISARFEPAAPDPQVFSPAGEKFENRAPEHTISLREMRIPSARGAGKRISAIAILSSILGARARCAAGAFPAATGAH